MDATTLAEQLAHYQLDAVPVTRADTGVTRIVELGAGWAMGDLKEEPALLTPGGGMYGVDLGPPQVAHWKRREERWITDHDRCGMPPELLPHPALLGAYR